MCLSKIMISLPFSNYHNNVGEIILKRKNVSLSKLNSRNMKKRHILLSILIVFVCIPAFAVFNEKNISHTLSVLRYELQQTFQRNDQTIYLDHSHDQQHSSMVAMVEKCNELALILYSQNQDFTFDMTYALQEVTQQYETFNREKMPYDEIIARLDIEIDRYQRLVEALRRLPPILDELDEVPDSIALSRDSLMKTAMIGMPAGQRPPRDLSGLDSLQRDSIRAARRAEMAAREREQSRRENENSGALTEAISIITGIELDEHDHDGFDSPEHRDGETLEEHEAHSHGRPFMLSERSKEDRDSCLFYARQILASYQELKEHFEADNEHYDDMSARLKESYDYAQDRYRLIQKRIFVQGQDDYITIIKTFPSYVRRAWNDARVKYSQIASVDEHGHVIKSSWRGPVVVGFIFFILIYLVVATILSKIIIGILSKKFQKLQSEDFQKKRQCATLIVGVIIFVVTVMLARTLMSQNFFVVASQLLLVYAWLMLATLASLYIRSKDENVMSGVKLYTPVLLLGLIVITFRVIFIPNRVVNLIYPPLLLLFAVWQIRMIRKYRKSVQKPDLIYAYITLVLMIVTAIITITGYVLLGVQIFIWWIFQLTAIATVTAFYDLLSMYEKIYLKKALERYREEHTIRVGRIVKGTYIKVTWIFDMIEMAAVPIVAVLSVPFCIWMASEVFDLREICRTIFMSPFFNLTDAKGSAILHLSLFKLVLVVSLYFVFRYLVYLFKALYRHYKLESVVKESGQDYVHLNQVNLTLANNLISIILWGIYIITAIVLLKIPMGALSVVAAGLATGIGLALKDVLNNFIYGIQLMSGRLRVGDYIECDGVRGKVDRISYQSTTIETLEGAVMAFTNATLFNNNFKNLTRNNSYELVKIPVGVHYGANVENVREVLSDSLKSLTRKDKYGRDVVETKKGVSVAFSGFGDNSVDLIVKFFVLVEESPAVVAKAKEIIYNTLNENKIEIPFPQRDIYIRQIPHESEKE